MVLNSYNKGQVNACHVPVHELTCLLFEILRGNTHKQMIQGREVFLIGRLYGKLTY